MVGSLPTLDELRKTVKRIALERLARSYELELDLRRIAEAHVERSLVEFATNAGRLLARLTLEVVGKDGAEQTVEYPASLWQAFKLAIYAWLGRRRLTAWLGRWLRRRRPVRYASFTYSAVQLFPELPIPNAGRETFILDMHDAPMSFAVPVPKPSPLTPEQRIRMLRRELQSVLEMLGTRPDPDLVFYAREHVRNRVEYVLGEDLRRNG